ncbi:MAG TPA: TolC family protein [Terriglobia bacterium]|nr:TolC family protein [Terriglobia bacterium]
MTTKSRYVVSASLLLLISTPMFGQAAPPQSPAPAVRSFTVQEAVNYALANYPAVRAAMERYIAAREGVGLAATSYLPSVNMIWQENRATRNNIAGMLLPQSVIPNPSGTVLPESGRSFWGSGTGVLFSYEPFDFGYRHAQVQAAKSTENRIQEELALTRLDVASAVADASLLVLAAEQQVRASQADVDRRTVFAKSVHALVDARLRPGADASRADAELAAARIRFVLAQQAERVNAAVFAQVLGLAGSRITIKPGPFEQAPSEKIWPTGSVSSHPAAIAEERRIEEAQARVKVLGRSYYPHIAVQALASARGSGANGQGVPLPGSPGLWPRDATNWATGFSVTFPLMDIASIRARKRIEMANQRREQALYDQTVQTLTGQMDQAEVVLDASRQIAQNTPVELRAATDSEAQARARFKAGLDTIVDVAEAQRLLLQAEIDDSLATLNIWRALARLAVAQGDLQPFIDLANHSPAGGH